MPNWRAEPEVRAHGGATGASGRSGVGIEDLSLDHSSSRPQMSGMFKSPTHGTGGSRTFARSLRIARRSGPTVLTQRHDSRQLLLRHPGRGIAELRYWKPISRPIIWSRTTSFSTSRSGCRPGSRPPGNVYGYNFSIDNFYVSGGNTAWMQACCYQHAAGLSYAPVGRQRRAGLDGRSDPRHVELGHGCFAIALQGWEQGKTQQTDAIHIYSFNRYFNIIGNVLGTDGFHTTLRSVSSVSDNF